MAVLDMFGRPIEAGDLIVYLSPKNHPLLVQSVKEPSLLGANPQQMPMGELRLSLNFGEPVPNPNRSPNVQFSDLMIVMKAADKQPQPGKPN
jgi:hypothetical protein